MKYHINPHTGVPSICYAEKGACPYGPRDEHYDSFEEAQDAAYLYMENKYSIFEDDYISDEYSYSDVDDEICDTTIDNNYSYLNNYSFDELIQELKETSNEELLELVLENNIELDADYHDEYIMVITQNPYFPKTIKNDVVTNTFNYSDEFVYSLLKNQELNEKELFSIAQNSRNHTIQKEALMNPAISTESIILNIGEDGRLECSRLALLLGWNPNCPETAAINALMRWQKSRPRPSNY